MIEKSKKQKIILVITFIVLFQESLFYLSTKNTINVLSITGMILFFINSKNIIKRKYQFKNLILCFILIQFFGIGLSKIYYQQGILQGIYGAHYIFIYGWYFFLVDLMRNNTTKPYKEYVEYAKNYLIKIGLFVVIIVNIQGLLYNKIKFLNLNYSLRHGLRISGCYIAVPIFIFLLGDILKEFKFKKLINIAIISFYLIQFNQSRSLIIVLIIGIILVYFKNLKLRKFKLKIIDCIVIYMGIIITTITFDYWSSLIYGMITEMVNVENTGGVRVSEMKYYYSLLKENHFLGIGILAYEFPLSEIIYGTTQYYYYLDDVGMFSMLFQTGFLGCIWLIAFAVKFIRVIKNNKDDEMAMVGYMHLYRMLFGFLTVQIFNNKYALIYFIIVLAMLEIKSEGKGCIGGNG